jgi:hypothetical protein
MKSRMVRTIFTLLTRLAVAQSSQAQADDAPANQTIVLIRHAEKPSAGLGQLNCQGLNRALALPPVLRKAFGIPVAIYAPNPSEQKPDSGKLYDYIRPLATIEPTAVAFGMPVHVDIGQSHIDDLQRELNRPSYRDKYVLVAWEHTQAMLLARAMMLQYGGDPKQVPDWKGDDFDSIYELKIQRSGSSATIGFELRHEGLDGQPTTCPGAAG